MQDSSALPYVDTPCGIMTAGGRWYHVTEEEVRDYAGEVLDHVSLEQLLRWADVWVESAETIVLWTLPPMLWWLPLNWAVAGALLLYVGWSLASPALPSLLAVRGVAALDHVIAQSVYYVVTMSAIAAAGLHAAVGIGLAGFVLLRWDVLRWASRHVLRPLQRTLYPLPVADQVLRGLIIRVALKHRLSVSQVREITDDILNNWHGHQDQNDPQHNN